MPSTKTWKRGMMDTDRDANAQNSWLSEGEIPSSAKPSEYTKDPYDGKGMPHVNGAEDENSRMSRLGKSQTVSGPKSRKNYDKSDAPFLKHTIKGKC